MHTYIQVSVCLDFPACYRMAVGDVHTFLPFAIALCPLIMGHGDRDGELDLASCLVHASVFPPKVLQIATVIILYY